VIHVACDALLFDMDGVLIDSTPAVARVWHRWALDHGFDPVEVVKKAHGRPSITTIREYLPRADHAAENKIVERSEIEDLEGVIALPGAMELLHALPAKRWAIVTSCTRPLAEVRLRATGMPRPACFVTCDDVASGKPAPEPFAKAARKLGFDPRNCVVVEDAPAGVLAGKAAGARVIAFPTTMPEQELRDAGADWILRDCGGISLEARDASGKLSLALKPLKSERAEIEEESAKGR